MNERTRVDRFFEASGACAAVLVVVAWVIAPVAGELEASQAFAWLPGSALAAGVLAALDERS